VDGPRNPTPEEPSTKTSRKALIALLALASAGAFAQAPATSAPGTNKPRIDKREARQKARIAKGTEDGSLTARETKRLEKEQGRIDNAEAKAKADGTVKAKERRHIARCSMAPAATPIESATTAAPPAPRVDPGLKPAEGRPAQSSPSAAFLRASAAS